MTYVTFKDGHMILDVSAYLATPEGKEAARLAGEQSERFRQRDDFLGHELRSIERAVTALGVILHFRDDGSFARAELPKRGDA